MSSPLVERSAGRCHPSFDCWGLTPYSVCREDGFVVIKGRGADGELSPVSTWGIRAWIGDSVTLAVLVEARDLYDALFVYVAQIDNG